MATHSRILAWEIQWTEEPGGLQSKGSQKGWTRLSDETTIECLALSFKVMNCSLHTVKSFLKKKFICAFWLHRVLIVAHGLSIEVQGLLSCCRTWTQQLQHSMLDLTSPTRNQTLVPCIGRQILNYWTTREVPHAYSIFQHIYASTCHMPGTVPSTRDAAGINTENSYRVYFPVITNEQTVNKPTSKYMVCVMVIERRWRVKSRI